MDGRQVHAEVGCTHCARARVFVHFCVAHEGRDKWMDAKSMRRLGALYGGLNSKFKPFRSPELANDPHHPNHPSRLTDDTARVRVRVRVGACVRACLCTFV